MRPPLPLARLALIYLLAGVLGALGLGGGAHAQTTAASGMVNNQPAAQKLFQAGLAALQAGRNQAAVNSFEASYAAAANPLTLFDLGIAYTNLGLVTQALGCFERYVGTADRARDAANIAAVAQEMARLRRENAVIRLRLEPAHARVAVDDVALTPLAGGELILPPRQHRIVVSALGFADYVQVATVPAGHFTLRVKLQPTAAPPPPSAAAPSVATKAEKPAPPGPPKPASSPCVLDDLCFGPLVGLGVPNALSISGQLRIGDYLGAGIGFYGLPSIHVSGVELSTLLFQVDARVYPFGGSFFLAIGFAHQGIGASASQRDASVEGHAGLPAFVLGLGFQGHDGFVMGLDLNFMFPTASTRVSIKMTSAPIAGVTQEQLDAAISTVRKQVKDGIDGVVAKWPFIPQLNVLRVGYMF